ncbi:MAG: class I SAM-dependent methyltransferase [bacterium]
MNQSMQNRKEDELELNRAAYDTHAENFASKFDQIGPRLEDMQRCLQLCGQEKPSVLEIGCGNGREAEALLPLVGSYVGIDISSRLLEIARQRVPEGRFELADVTEYEFPADLDIIFAFASLLHLDREQMAEVLQKVSSSLKSGGVIHLSLQHGPYRRQEKDDGFGRRVFYFYDLPSLEELMPQSLETVWSKVQTKREKGWLEIVFRKK